MSESKSKKNNPTFALGTGLWVKLLNRVWWPGTVVDPLTTPQELIEYMKTVEPIAGVVKFKSDVKYHVVTLTEEVYLYSSDRKIEFIEKGISLYKSHQKGLKVIGNFDMNNFKKDVISMERRIGGDIRIFEKLIEKQENAKSIIKQFFTPTNTKKSKKKEVERKSLPAPKLPNTPNQPKPRPVSRPRTSIQSQVGKTKHQGPTSIGYRCHSQVDCKFTTNRYDNLRRHMAIHKNDKDVVTTKKSSPSSTSNKRKNLKTKSSEVKRQKLQEELLKDWDNDGEDEDEELNISRVQSSSNVAQSSNEEVLQTLIDVKSSDNVVQSSNEEIVQTTSDVLSSSNVAQSSNAEVVHTVIDVQSSSNVQSSNEEVLQTVIDVQSSSKEVLQTMIDVQSSTDVQSSNEEVLQTIIGEQSSSNVQSSNEEVLQTMIDDLPTLEVLSSKNYIIPTISEDITRNSEVQKTSTSSPNQVFDFNENDNNTPVVELRQIKSDCSSTVDDDISETFESRITPDIINNTIFDASPSKSLLVGKSTEDFIDKPHGIHSNELTNEIDNQTKGTELLLEKTVNTLDQINNFENSLSCISSSINIPDANILTEDNNVVIGVSELGECGSLIKTASLYKDIDIETNGVGIPLIENMSSETEDCAIVEDNTNDKEIVSNDEEVKQLNGTTIDKNMPIENSCSVDSTSNKMDCEDKIPKKKGLLDDIPYDQFFSKKESPGWKHTESALKKADFINNEDITFIPTLNNILVSKAKQNVNSQSFLSDIQDTKQPYILGASYDIYLPIDFDGNYPKMENLTPDVNPITKECQRAMMENSFLKLGIIDKWT